MSRMADRDIVLSVYQTGWPVTDLERRMFMAARLTEIMYRHQALLAARVAVAS
jgi:hypothetical protein